MRASVFILIAGLLCAMPATLNTGGKSVSHPDYSRLDRSDVLMILFHPRPDHSPNRGDGIDVRVPVAEDIHVGGRLHIADKNSPVILLFHGNGEIVSDYDFIAQWYKEIGISLLVVDYRGYGRSSGKPTSSALIKDAITTYNSVNGILSEHGLDGSRLFIMGRSLGSAAAIEVASHAGNKISGLIVESGFAHTFPLLERLGGLSFEEVNERDHGFNSPGKMESVKVPTLIIHGEDDFLIPISDGKDLFNHCAASDKRFVPVPNAGHNDLMLNGRQIYFEAIRKFAFR